MIPPDVFRVYGDDQSGVTLHCWDCHWQVEWPEGGDLLELVQTAEEHQRVRHPE